MDNNKREIVMKCYILILNIVLPWFSILCKHKNEVVREFLAIRDILHFFFLLEGFSLRKASSFR